MNVKLFLVLLFTLGLLSNSKTQSAFDEIPSGAFFSLYNFINKNPTYQCDFTFTPLSYDPTNTIFNIESRCKNIRIKPKTLNKEILLVFDGNNLYFNGFRFGMGKGYLKAQITGRYCYIKGRGILTQGDKNLIANSGFYFGLIGTMASAGYYESRNRKLHDYIIDLNTGNLHTLDSLYIDRVLKTEPDLLHQFHHESGEITIELLLKYIIDINNRSQIAFIRD